MRSLAAPATSTMVLMPEHSRKLLGGVPNPDDGCLGLIPYGYLMFIYDSYYESQPGSWLVVICERSENRGSGGGSCQTGPKLRK